MDDFSGSRFEVIVVPMVSPLDKYRQRGSFMPKDGTKRCGRCKEVKPLSGFHKNRAIPCGYASYCKGCAKVNSLDKHLRRVYGVTLQWYQEKLAEQGGVCAICQKPERMRLLGSVLRLAVDHEHDDAGMGTPRGLVCNRCNQAIAGVEHLGEVGLLNRTKLYFQEHNDAGLEDWICA